MLLYTTIGGAIGVFVPFISREVCCSRRSLCRCRSLSRPLAGRRLLHASRDAHAPARSAGALGGALRGALRVGATSLLTTRPDVGLTAVRPRSSDLSLGLLSRQRLVRSRRAPTSRAARSRAVQHRRRSVRAILCARRGQAEDDRRRVGANAQRCHEATRCAAARSLARSHNSCRALTHRCCIVRAGHEKRSHSMSSARK